MRSGVLLELINKAARAGVWCSGAVMIIVAFLIGGEVISRKFFGYHLVAADELAGYALAITTSWAVSYTLLERGHIRVDALYILLPQKIRAVLDMLSLAGLFVFAGTLCWFAYDLWATSWNLGSTSNTPMSTPLWIPQGLWLIGLSFFVLTIFVLLVRTALLLFAGDTAAVGRLAGTRSVSDDLIEEVQSLETATPELETTARSGTR